MNTTTKTVSTTPNPYNNYDDDFIYSDPFPSGRKDNMDFLTDDFEERMAFYSDIIWTCKPIYDISAFINLFVNLPHLLILSRKELRSNLVYIIMMGICFCDLIHSIGKIAQVSMTWGIFYEPSTCLAVYPYFHVMTDIISKCMQIMSRRCSAFLALFIASFRAFSVMFPMSNAVNFLMKAKSGYLIVIVTMVICSGWSSMYYFKTIILNLTTGCIRKPKWGRYRQDSSGKDELQIRVIDSYITLVVCCLYLLVTTVLIIALAKANKRRKNLKSDKSTNTSFLIVFMAIVMLLSESAYAALFLVSYFVFMDFQERSMFEGLEFVAMTLSMIASITHCFICFFMSSQYRDVVKGLLCFGKEKDANLQKVFSKRESIAHPTTVQTTKTSNTSKRTI